MSYFSRARYAPVQAPANSTTSVTSDSIGGFLCVTAGTLTVTRHDGTVVINALPVVAGTWVDIPFYMGVNQYSVTTAGGASGIVAA
jgi:hypothetical protein